MLYLGAFYLMLMVKMVQKQVSDLCTVILHSNSSLQTLLLLMSFWCILFAIGRQNWPSVCLHICFCTMQSKVASSYFILSFTMKDVRDTHNKRESEVCFYFRLNTPGLFSLMKKLKIKLSLLLYPSGLFWCEFRRYRLSRCLPSLQYNDTRKFHVGIIFHLAPHR